MPHVCMVIEGAYPYIAGGVSAWCHKLITELKDIDFTLLVILPASYRGKKYKYKLPDNVKVVDEVWLDKDYFPKNRKKATKEDKANLLKEIQSFHSSMRLKNYKMFGLVYKLLSRHFKLRDFTRSKEAIQTLFNMYRNTKNNSRFMRFFWTWKSTHLPIFRILKYPLPKADVYHAVSTGYAGFLSTIAKLNYNIPFILTEHGIYAMEREDELKSSKLIFPDQRQMWIDFFHGLCRISYSFADKIITLFRGNLFIEVSNNANADRIEIIPNGVDIEQYLSLTKIKNKDRIVVAIVARVVPIKDVKTFIRAASIAKDQVPEADFYIVGPTDEDEEYYKECLEMVEDLGLKERITFTGMVNMKEFYPKIDILVLTSSREAQPLVLLEAMCCGIPCIATNVGACSEMLEDVGFITTPGKAEETAEAIVTLCKNKELREELEKKGREKVIASYNIKDLLESYRYIYHSFTQSAKQQQMEQRWLA